MRIPHSKVLQYGHQYGYGNTVDELFWFVHLIRRMDLCYLEWLENKRKEEQRKADRAAKRRGNKNKGGGMDA